MPEGPIKKHDWTIQGFHGYGTLVHPTKGTIIFGRRFHVKHQSKGVAQALQRIDLSTMAHGGNDSAVLAIPSFIAAADRVHEVLGLGGNKVYLHCGHGNSRTAFALMTYLARHDDKFTWDGAVAFVTSGQMQRTDIAFEADRKGVNGSYLQWLDGAQERILDKATGHSASHTWITEEGGVNVYKVGIQKARSKKRKEPTPASEPDEDTLSRSQDEPARKRPRRTEADRLEEETSRILKGADWQTRYGRGFKR